MYNIKRRTTVSSVIPAIILILLIPRLLELSKDFAKTWPSFLELTFIILTIYVVSVVFLFVETIIYLYITEKDNPTNAAYREAIKKGGLGRSLAILSQADMQMGNQRITHSVLFQCALWVVIFYAVTSSNSILGVGIPVAMGLQIIVDQLLGIYRYNQISDWFWQIKRSIDSNTQRIYVAIAAISYIVLFYMYISKII